MTSLIPQDNYGVTERKGIPVVSSRSVAERFCKRHDNVLRDIESLFSSLKIEESNNLETQFCAANFIKTEYKARGKKYPEYLLTRDGFTFITMGFTGSEAAKFKIAYINKFNEMESFIKSLTAAKLEFPEFTAAIMAAHEEPAHYHFSNELNMINKIVLGMTAKQFKQANNINDVSSIRPYLDLEQIKAIENLQKADMALVVAIPDFQQRKKILQDYHNRMSLKKLA